MVVTRRLRPGDDNGEEAEGSGFPQDSRLFAPVPTQPAAAFGANVEQSIGGGYDWTAMSALFGWINFAWIKRGLLLFWSLWYSVVVTTNVLNALQALGILPASFKFVSGNWEWINQTMNPLGVPITLQAFLFAGVIVWEMLCAILFFMAYARFRNRTLIEEKESLWACAVALAFWCTFQVLDEVFLAYGPESVHRVIFIETILTMIFLQWMPRSTPRE